MENSVVKWTENWRVNQTKIGWKTGQNKKKKICMSRRKKMEKNKSKVKKGR